MPFPASNGVLSDVLEQASRGMLQVKQQAERESARMAAGNVSASSIIDIDVRLRGWRDVLAGAAAVPGIGAYAQAQLGDAELNVAAEFNAILTAIDAVTGWIRTNFPRDASGFLLAQTWGANGPVDRQFTPAQTANLRPLLDALAATVS